MTQGTRLNVTWQPGWEDLGAEWIHVHVCLSPLTVRLKPSQHCLLIGCTPKQNKGF